MQLLTLVSVKSQNELYFTAKEFRSAVETLVGFVLNALLALLGMYQE